MIRKFYQLNQKYPIPAFIIKLLVIFLVLDYFFQFLIATASPEGTFYIPVIANQLNFVRWYENFLLNAGGNFAGLFGYDFIINGKNLSLVNGSGVVLGYSCIGFSVMSLYVAFILSYPAQLKKKIIYFFSGLALIIGLNIMRIGGLAVIYTRYNTPSVRSIDHHAVFNYTVYAFILLVFFLYTRSYQQPTLQKT